MSTHIEWLREGEELETLCKRKVKIIEFEHDENEDILNEWAKHLRNHYCKDELIDEMRSGTGLSRAEYLRELVFPEAAMVISGDFAEILTADYLEYMGHYVIPRIRYLDKFNKETSPNGTDIIGFKMYSVGQEISEHDKLITCEVKARLVTKKEDVLQDSITHAKKDMFRLAETLNATKQRLKLYGETSQVQLIQRFQNKVENPYTKVTSAAVVHSNEQWDPNFVSGKILDVQDVEDIYMLVIKGDALMEVARSLFRRASDEA